MMMMMMMRIMRRRIRRRCKVTEEKKKMAAEYNTKDVKRKRVKKMKTAADVAHLFNRKARGEKTNHAVTAGPLLHR